jgi:hypothetical protein
VAWPTFGVGLVVPPPQRSVHAYPRDTCDHFAVSPCCSR